MFNYQERIQKLIAKVEKGLIFLPGNTHSPINYKENHYPFRQDSNFQYFIGINRPDLAAIIDCDSGKTILFGNENSIDDIIWTGHSPTLTELAVQLGIQEVLPFNKLFHFFSHPTPIHYLPPYRGDNKILLSSLLDKSINEIEISYSSKLIDAVVELRSIKENEEIKELEKAVNISGLMHVAAMSSARIGKTEGYLTGLVESIATELGSGTSYPTILTMDGQILHNHDHHGVLSDGRLVLGDFGAATKTLYAGDITRTFPVSPKFSIKQREIYSIVLESLETAIAACKPDVAYRDVHLMVCKIIFDGLKQLGLVKGDSDEAVHLGAHALFFPHGLGHLIGLDVHDMEDLGENNVGYNDQYERSTQFGLKSLRFAKKLNIHHTLTVEPGIYFIPQLIEKWSASSKFHDFINYQKVNDYLDFGGIRIEENICITPSGAIVLGQPIPKSILEIENIRVTNQR
jgi:Xaa-Pro aminopeptidase